MAVSFTVPGRGGHRSLGPGPSWPSLLAFLCLRGAPGSPDWPSDLASYHEPGQTRDCSLFFLAAGEGLDYVILGRSFGPISTPLFTSSSWPG